MHSPVQTQHRAKRRMSRVGDRLTWADVGGCHKEPTSAWLALQLHRVAENRQLAVSSRPNQERLLFQILLDKS